MSDFDFPDLPSDEELGITPEDRKKYEEELGDDGPEMTDAELTALLGDTPAPPKSGTPSGASAKAGSKPPDDGAARKQASKQVRKAEKAAKKEAKRAEKERKKREKARRTAEKKAAARVPADGPSPGGDAPTGDADATSAAEGPRSRWRGPATLAALLATVAFGSSRTGLPAPVPANSPDSVFSSSRAMTTLVDMVRRAHPTGSPEHARVRDFLVAELTELGFAPEIQTTTSLVQNGARARAATVRNIVARRPGSAPTGGVLITAHYDSREIAVGAGDDGSGVVTALEALRALQTGPGLRNDLIVVFTDAEELGLMGARAFVDEHPLMADVDIVLSFEMRGAGGPSIMFETADRNGWIVRTMSEWDRHPFANSMSYEVYRRMPNGTDFTPFIEAGAQGLNYAAIDNAHVYHQVYDTPDNLSEATLQHHGVHALGALRYYGDADLSEVNDDNVVYFSVAGLGLFVYDQRWVLPISGGLLALLALVTVVGRRAGARPSGMALGLLLTVLAGAGSWGVGYGLMRWLPGLHGEDGTLHGSVFHHEGWYVLAIGFSALFLVTLLNGVLRRWSSAAELSIGALVVPAGAAVALSVVAPLGAMNLQWPTIAAALSVLILSVLRERGDGHVGWLSTLLLAVPVILLFQPIVELIWLAMTLRMAGVIGVLFTLMALLCLPALDALRHPNAWWAPATTALLAGAFLGIGVLGARPSADRPAPSTLAYAYEHGSGDAMWVGAPGEADAPGVAWAASAADATFEGTRDLTSFGYPFGDVPVSSAPVFDATPPEVHVVTDTVVSGARVAELRLRSRIGAEAMQFHLADGVVLEAINGVPLENAGAVRMADHWGQPDGWVALRLRMPAGEAIGLHVVEHLLRPDEIVGEGRFDRPGRIAPNVNRMSDRAMFRFSVAALADPQYAIVDVPPVPPELLGGTTPATVPADTSVAAPDSTGVPAAVAIDSTMAPLDTTGLTPDSSATPQPGVPVDTVAPPDTSATTDTIRTAARHDL